MLDLKPAAQGLIDLLGMIDPTEFDHPTPCTEYTVADLLEHLDEMARGSTALASRAPEPALLACLDHVTDFVPKAPIPELWGSTVSISADAPLLDRIVAITGRVP